MNIEQLINKLKEYPPDTKVFVDGYEAGLDELTEVNHAPILLDDYPENDVFGPHQEIRPDEISKYVLDGRKVIHGIILPRKS